MAKSLILCGPTKKYLISDIIVLSFVFICCWYRFLSYIEVFFWLHNVKFEFPKFSFSWFHRPIKDCLFLRLKTEMCWAIKDKWIKGLTCYLFKVWLFWKKNTVFRKNLKVDNYSYCIKPKQDKIKSSNIVEKI